ncbi:MAG: hypothetical protein WC624_03175 [Candidatus Margulisiibacteriota bacterium]
MQIKATIDCNQRKVGMVGLLWNRLTPTRGMGSVVGAISQQSRSGKLTIEVSPTRMTLNDGSQQQVVSGSQYLARTLYAAGVTSLEIDNEISADEMRQDLNFLTDHPINKSQIFDLDNTIKLNLAHMKLVSYSGIWHSYFGEHRDTSHTLAVASVVMSIPATCSLGWAYHESLHNSIIANDSRSIATMLMVVGAPWVIGALAYYGTRLAVDSVIYGAQLCRLPVRKHDLRQLLVGNLGRAGYARIKQWLPHSSISYKMTEMLDYSLLMLIRRHIVELEGSSYDPYLLLNPTCPGEKLDAIVTTLLGDSADAYNLKKVVDHPELAPATMAKMLLSPNFLPSKIKMIDSPEEGHREMIEIGYGSTSEGGICVEERYITDKSEVSHLEDNVAGFNFARQSLKARPAAYREQVLKLVREKDPELADRLVETQP